MKPLSDVAWSFGHLGSNPSSVPDESEFLIRLQIGFSPIVIHRLNCSTTIVTADKNWMHLI